MSAKFSAFGFVFALVVILGLQGQIASAEAGLITVKIDLSSQRMDVYQNGRRLYRWRVSTGTHNAKSISLWLWRRYLRVLAKFSRTEKRRECQ
ncbi:MAG: L,D-transpeptidase [Rhodobacteraceae bacterium]|nr:L,D-transpeptidase [Paracoccaceae bacterium]